VWLTLSQTGAYLCHEIAVKDLLNSLGIEVAQHVGIASTTGFDIASGIDMPATPGGRAKEIRHPVFTGVLVAPRCFGFAVVLTSKTIGN
jgi:hypothetical protein